MTKPKQKILVPMPNDRRIRIYLRNRRVVTARQARRIRKHNHRDLG
jgi:hypothetical protein